MHLFGANFTPHSRGAPHFGAPRVSVGPSCTILARNFPHIAVAQGTCVRHGKYIIWWRSPPPCATAKPGCTLTIWLHHHHPLFSSSPLLFLLPTSFSDLLAHSSSPPHFLLSLHIFYHINPLIFFIYICEENLPHVVLDLPPPRAVSLSTSSLEGECMCDG